MQTDQTEATHAAESAPVDNGKCFVCGPDSEQGLRLRFVAPAGAPREVHAQTVLDGKFQGWVGFAHGGVVCMLLDEAMAHAAGRAGRCGVTAGMKIRFRRPTPLAQQLHVGGELLERRGRVLRLKAWVRDGAGVLLASAEGDFIDRGPIDPESLFGRIGAPNS